MLDDGMWCQLETSFLQNFYSRTCEYQCRFSKVCLSSFSLNRTFRCLSSSCNSLKENAFGLMLVDFEG